MLEIMNVQVLGASLPSSTGKGPVDPLSSGIHHICSSNKFAYARHSLLGVTHGSPTYKFTYHIIEFPQNMATFLTH